MDLMNIIDSYIEISIKRDNLNRTIENAKKGYSYAETEGKIAFIEGDYKREAGYNKSSEFQAEILSNAQNELKNVAQLLESTNQNYISSVSSMSSEQLIEASNIMFSKKYNMENNIEKLSKRLRWLTVKGDQAFKNHNLSEEKSYNRMASECKAAINNSEPKIRYYQSFANDLYERFVNADSKKY